MRQHLVYLILGTNLGDRFNHLEKARIKIEEYIGTISKISSVYETEPWHVDHQPFYLNQAIEVFSPLSPLEVLQEIHIIERELGRVRQKKYDSRTIDIDIAFWDNLIMDENNLQIPHPRIHLRKFALIPLMELNRSILHPVLKQTVEKIFEQCKDDSKVVKIINEKGTL